MIWCLVLAVAAQEVLPPLVFQTASIKVSEAPFRTGNSVSISGDGVTGKGTTLKSLVALAYDVSELEVEGGPRWIATERYDLEAKTEYEDTSSNRVFVRAQLRTLLERRFKLRVRRETKEAGTYVLLRGGGLKMPEYASGARPSMSAGPGFLVANRATMAMLAQGLSAQLGSRVIDETGLKGLFDFKLTWERKQSIRPAEGPLAAVEKQAGSVLMAVEEQLGLRLEVRNQQTSIVVVEAAEKI